MMRRVAILGLLFLPMALLFGQLPSTRPYELGFPNQLGRTIAEFRALKPSIDCSQEGTAMTCHEDGRIFDVTVTWYFQFTKGKLVSIYAILSDEDLEKVYQALLRNVGPPSERDPDWLTIAGGSKRFKKITWHFAVTSIRLEPSFCRSRCGRLLYSLDWVLEKYDHGEGPIVEYQKQL